MTLPFAVLGIVACGGAQEPATIATDISAIVGGRVATQSYHDAVVGIHERLGDRVSAKPFCTGTLVKADVVVTAAHCLDKAEAGLGEGAREASALAIYIGSGVEGDEDPIFVGVSDDGIYSGFDSTHVTGDIAYIRLAQAIPATLARPIPALPTSQKLTDTDVGAQLEFVGFGISEGGLGQRLTTQGTLDELGETQIAYLQRTGGPCSGDSGGPAFITRGNTRYLAGVTSYGDQNCRYFGVSTRTDAYATFLRGL